MAETAFGVAYDGPALADGRMAVRDLAPALLALGDLLADAGVTAYPDRGPVTLNIQAAPERGSFVIHLILEAKGVWDQVTSFFDSEGITALNNLEGIVFGPVGIFALIKWLRGRKVKKQERVREGYIRLTLEDGETIEVPTTVVELNNNPAVREKAREVVAPLETEGVDSVEFRPSSQPALRVEVTDLPSFQAAEPGEEELGTHETVMVLSIDSVVFREGNKWRLSDGENTFWADIEDEAWLARVRNGRVSFRSGDMLRCRIEVTQVCRGDRLHTERRVLEVLEHIPTEIQLELGEDDGS
jgi:hypothetical protein